jgi:hypothetical protein
MYESTILASFHAVFHAMASDEELLNTYLSSMIRVDAEWAARLHKVYSIDGMALSLDCCHIGWKNCPVAWQGQFEGKEGEPTIVLEAAVNHDLYFLHTAFRYPGTQNDLVIWECLPFLICWRMDIGLHKWTLSKSMKLVVKHFRSSGS